MADDIQADPATDLVTDNAVSPATGGGRDDIASDLRASLAGTELSTQEKSPREQMRNQIGAELAKATGEKPVDAKPAEAKPAVERARGPDGKFIQTQQEANDAAAIDNAPPVAVKPEDAMPASWRKDLQAKWATVDPELRAEIVKREADVAKGFEKYQGFRAHEPVLDWVKQVAPQYGMNDVQVVMSWAQTQEALLDPARKQQTIMALARQYGVDLTPQVPQAQTQQPVQPGQEPAWVDPDVAALKQQLAEVTNWKTQFEQQQAQQYQQQVQQVQTQKLSLIDQFASEKSQDGQPLRPHLETVMPQMARLIADIKAANPSIPDQEALQQAYDNAVWGNPATREALIQAQKVAEETERNRVARQRAQAAQRGAVSPATASPQGPPASVIPKGDIRDQLRANLNAVTA
jgi:hypothetical protein